MATRLFVALVIACAIVGGQAGCSLIGGRTVSREEATETNLANQRKVASLFLDSYPHPELTAIRFTREGGRPGIGVPWNVNVVVSVAGKDYNEILATNDVWGGDPLPELQPGSTHGPVTVRYSDGTAEVFQ